MIPEALQKRIRSTLDKRRENQLLRKTAVPPQDFGFLNLADNDYLALARDPALIAAARKAAENYGCSSSASPLVSGFGPAHRKLESKLCDWHRFPNGLIWNSGYVANQAILSHLPQKNDLIFADRLIHNSMISGILRSGARLIRFCHNDFDHLRELLQREEPKSGIRFVVTESIFSMDGDSPNLADLVSLKNDFPFCLIVDEAHATGWYGKTGAGLVEELKLNREIDILVGTLGKTLASQGACTLFHNPDLRDFFINQSGEFIYSTYLSPIAAAVAEAAIERVCELVSEQKLWRKTSSDFRTKLRENDWKVPEGDSPIVPVQIGKNEDLLSLNAFLRKQNILAGAIRPPTVPEGTARIRFSLNRNFSAENAERILELLNRWRDFRK